MGPLRQAVRQAQPNAAHYALARLQQESSCTVSLVTQNVDGLHPKAGFENSIELHGSLLRSRCSHCDLPPFEDPEGEARPCPACGHLLRPDIVLFGERIPEPADLAAFGAVLQCDLFVAIGTSGSVAPASTLVRRADSYGVPTYLLHLEPLVPPNPAFHHEILGRAEEILPHLFLWPGTGPDTDSTKKKEPPTGLDRRPSSALDAPFSWWAKCPRPVDRRGRILGISRG